MKDLEVNTLTAPKTNLAAEMHCVKYIKQFRTHDTNQIHALNTRPPITQIEVISMLIDKSTKISDNPPNGHVTL